MAAANRQAREDPPRGWAGCSRSRPPSGTGGRRGRKTRGGTSWPRSPTAAGRTSCAPPTSTAASRRYPRPGRPSAAPSAARRHSTSVLRGASCKGSSRRCAPISSRSRTRPSVAAHEGRRQDERSVSPRRCCCAMHAPMPGPLIRTGDVAGGDVEDWRHRRGRAIPVAMNGARWTVATLVRQPSAAGRTRRRGGSRAPPGQRRRSPRSCCTASARWRRRRSESPPPQPGRPAAELTSRISATDGIGRRNSTIAIVATATPARCQEHAKRDSHGHRDG